ncbi:hypothetical protein [Mycobacterium bourgelatii]|uniref:Uncharacterized protein n=1 Tax=Mycobacterium bourgelatii TaxID=1273442 RepID=A0A7I9YPX9_MYCBU|nr:hypothetical protein [Mycobacterium bourgelatii]MCV6972902.1 hypothetical protein [Mycobacterium bourgelatii]GFG90735.1 hypothetical protein MBOU_27770 [Mycobacterium bourgelatii]
MTLKKFAAGAAMAGGFALGAFGLGAGVAQADPNIPGIPGPVCPGGPGVNCNGPGTPLPPGQHGFPPPGHYNDPVSYGLPATWVAPNTNVALPVVFNPSVGAWGVFTPDGVFVAITT